MLRPDVYKRQVLIINPVDSAAISTSVEAANAKNIPVITVDRSADKGKVVAHIASDNVKGGEMAAQLIVEKVGKAAKVAEIEGIDRKSTRLNSSHLKLSRMPSSA